MRKLLTALVAILFLSPAFAAWAQTYPSRPLKIIVPFGPGTITDTLTRIYANELSIALGQPVVVVNKGGADGSIGATEAARSAPDGYTLIVAPNSSIAVVPLLRKVPPYDPLADFTPISFMGDSTFLFVVHPSVPVNTIAELIAHAKANPNKLNYASANTTSIVSTALLAANNGITMQHVPYKSEPEAIPDLLSGQIQVMMASYATLGPHVKAGKLRALATGLPERTPHLPDVPSITEAGQPKFSVGPWAALLGPAKLPPEIVARLNKETVTILNRPDIKEQMQKYGFAPKSSTPEAFTAYLKEQMEIWKAALKTAGIEAQ
ncbi:MAG: Bug family tripartite tricarboxylate transporter substrate binding protein [Hyphomicrobiaceae bacterium]